MPGLVATSGGRLNGGVGIDGGVASRAASVVEPPVIVDGANSGGSSSVGAKGTGGEVQGGAGGLSWEEELLIALGGVSVSGDDKQPEETEPDELDMESVGEAGLSDRGRSEEGGTGTASGGELEREEEGRRDEAELDEVSQASAGAAGGAMADGGLDAVPGGAGSHAGPATEVFPDYEGVWTFDSTTDGFGAAIPSPPEIAVSSTFTSEDGSPAPGALRVRADFSAAGQYAAFDRGWDLPLDLSGQRLYARVKLLSGLSSNPDAPGYGVLWLSTGADWVIATGPYVPLRATGEWQLLSLNIDDPDELAGDGVYDPSETRELGIVLYTGADPKAAEPAVLLVDSIGY